MTGERVLQEIEDCGDSGWIGNKWNYRLVIGPIA